LNRRDQACEVLVVTGFRVACSGARLLGKPSRRAV